MRRFPILLSLLTGAAASSSAQGVYQGAPAAPLYAPPVATSDIDYALSDWRRLRQSDGYSFADYARFIAYNPGWPGEAGLRKAAERAMRSGESPASVLGFFATRAPQSGNGYARLAEGLLATGRPIEALGAAREALASPDLAGSDEAGLLGRFASQVTAADYDRRIDALLFDRKTSDAERLLPWASPARRASFAARVALQARAFDLEAQYAAVAARSATDAGLLMDRARYLRDTGNEALARSLLAQPHQFTSRPANPERWFELMLAAARDAAADRQYVTAYNIARQVDDAFPAGTDIALKPLGVRDDYTSLTWLAGSTALTYLGRPSDAVPLFDRYSRGGRSLQVASKGQYWAGRAAMSAARMADANAYFTKAAANPDLFYGQLALERLARPIPAPRTVPAVPVTAAQRLAFSGKRLARAVRQLGAQGRRDEQTLFIRALSEALDSDADRILATELATQIGRQDLAVWTARSARNNGSSFYVRAAYPLLSGGLADPRLWAITHGITRQESSFDRGAISGAGARGMMQLMLGTAQEQAGKIGASYDWTRLTSDPAYNVMLGSSYFGRLLDQWRGSYPLAVASYNAGAGNVRKWVNAYGDPRQPGVDIVRWVEQIPFTETRGYVQRVLENAAVYDRINPSGAPNGPRHLSLYLGKTRPG